NALAPGEAAAGGRLEKAPDGFSGEILEVLSGNLFDAEAEPDRGPHALHERRQLAAPTYRFAAGNRGLRGVEAPEKVVGGCANSGLHAGDSASLPGCRGRRSPPAGTRSNYKIDYPCP